MNDRQRVGRAIESVLAQNLQDFEVVVVDNASNDGTAAAVENYCQRDDRVRLIRNPETVHMYRNHNICWQNAAADWVVFLHADDTLVRQGLDVLDAHIRDFTDVSAFLPPNQHVKPYIEAEVMPLSGRIGVSQVVRWHGAMVCGSCYRRRVISEYGFSEDTLSGDWELPARILSDGGSVAFTKAEVVSRYLGEERWSARINANEGFTLHNVVVIRRILASGENEKNLRESLRGWSQAERDRLAVLLAQAGLKGRFRAALIMARLLGRPTL